jgi:hypothetical protein
MKKHELEKKIETALNSLDHVCRAGPGPFFYTRVHARLNKKDRTVWEKISGFIAQPVVAFTVICLIISANTLVIFNRETTPALTEQNNSVFLSDDSEVDTIAFYDEENNNTDTQ